MGPMVRATFKAAAFSFALRLVEVTGLRAALPPVLDTSLVLIGLEEGYHLSFVHDSSRSLS